MYTFGYMNVLYKVESLNVGRGHYIQLPTGTFVIVTDIIGHELEVELAAASPTSSDTILHAEYFVETLAAY